MRRFTSTIHSSTIDLLREHPIREAYVNHLSPKKGFLFGTSVDLFFEGNELSIKGEIVEDEQGIEGSALVFGATLGIDYWHTEMLIQRGRPIIEATELTSLWADLSYGHFVAGPREVRLYTNAQLPARESGTTDVLIGLELIALGDSSQRVLFVASEEGSPGDVEMLMPSKEYELALASAMSRR